MTNSPTTSTIILCGGRIDPRDLPVSLQQSNAMIPVNGRPVIGWILNDLLEKKIDDVVVVTRAEDISLHHFLERSYTDRLNLKLARLYRPGTIVESLKAGVHLNDQAEHIRVVLGDTLITDSYHSSTDFVYTGAVEYNGRWCLVECNPAGQIVTYIDKQSDTDASAAAIAGYYHFTNAQHLRTCIDDAVSAGEQELSNILTRYGRKQPILTKPVQEWFDFGHLDKLADARRRLISSRSFNTLAVDPVLQTVTKTSTRNEKLADELNWYLRLPASLQVLTPRIVSHQITDQQVKLTQEFYGYSSLAELFVFGDFSLSAWDSILQRILDVHQLLARHEGHVTSAATFDMYFTKTAERLELLRQDPQWERLLQEPTIRYNGTEYRNFPALMPQIEDFCKHLASTVSGSIIHGDLCFSNILFDLPNQIVRLIDPRGSFGAPGIFGDPRYDAAKLRHSVCGMYDFIVSDMFAVQRDGPVFEGRVYSSNQPSLELHFDVMLTDAGYDIQQIQFIEGLLFASMIPLHTDRPLRQKMMFCRAIELLNTVLPATDRQDSKNGNSAPADQDPKSRTVNKP